MRKIDRDTYLKACGLFHLAAQHQRKAREFEKAINDLLGLEAESHVSDEIYEANGTTDLDAALARSGIEVSGE